MRVTDKYVFFWNGIYSQWYPAPMTIDGIEYNTCEQYMMHQKAITFKDYDIAKQILEEDNPGAQKALGRQIQGFDKAIWDKVCLSIVYKGNLNKFTQNTHLLKSLKDTENRILVEASPVDHIWGIGMAENDKGVEDPVNWKGLNLLGVALNLVRQTLV